MDEQLVENQIDKKFSFHHEGKVKTRCIVVCIKVQRPTTYDTDKESSVY